jgi:pyruvate,water dikinase
MQGEMLRTLCIQDGKHASHSGAPLPHCPPISIPYGFCTTTAAYHQFMQVSGVESTVRALLSTLDRVNFSNLAAIGAHCRQFILNTKLPQQIEREIRRKYTFLCAAGGTVEARTLERSGTCETRSDVTAADAEPNELLPVAVRSSVMSEDLADASFAGQQDSFLNVRGIDNVLKYCVECYASLYTNRAISYRERHGIPHDQVALRSFHSTMWIREASF